LQEADTDASLQEADTDVSLQEADTDASLQEAATDVSLQEADTDASLQEADIDAEMTCMPGQQQPAAMAETIDLQSITGASGQHNACQIPPDVHSSSRHPSVADAHDVLHLLAGAQSSDDLSMQQLHILAGKDAQSSDGTTTLCDSPIGSVSSLGVDDRLSRFGQAAAMPRPGAGQIDGSTELGLTDLSMEATVSRLHAEETESLPEHQRAGSADSTATPVEEEWLMQQTSYEVSYQTLLSVCKSGCSSWVIKAHAQPVGLKHLVKMACGSLPTVKKHACLLLPFGLLTTMFMRWLNPACPSPALSLSRWSCRSKCNASPLMSHNWL